MRQNTINLIISKSRMFAFCFWATWCSVAATEVVVREISSEGGIVWVEDRLRIGDAPSGGVASLKVELEELVEKVRHGDTNVLSCIRTLLEPDEMNVESYSVAAKSDYVDLKIVSKVRFNPAQTAKLRWVATIGALSMTLGGVEIGDKAADLLIYRGASGQLLCVPDFGSPTNAAATARDSWKFCKVIGPQKLHLTCMLKTANSQEVLLDWNSDAPEPDAPDLGMVSRAHETQKLSRNDLLRLFTNAKIAKSGYYVIGHGGYQRTSETKAASTSGW